jgi:hypothetical protein
LPADEVASCLNFIEGETMQHSHSQPANENAYPIARNDGTSHSVREQQWNSGPNSYLFQSASAAAVDSSKIAVITYYFML